MDYMLYGTDRRMEHLAVRLSRAGHRVYSWEGVRGAHIVPVSTPLEVGYPVRLLLPLSAPEEVVLSAAGALPVGSRIYGGACPAGAQKVLKHRGIGWTDLSADDAYCRENAIPTAEGALKVLIEVTPRCIPETTVLVLGSGRVAQAMVTLLRTLGAPVIVCARSAEGRRWARGLGCRALSLPPSGGRAAAELYRVAALVNTVPAKHIVSGDLLRTLKRGTPLLELASGKDNIDLAAAAARACPVYALPALPGKVAPQSAADALFSAITKPEKDG